MFVSSAKYKSMERTAAAIGIEYLALLKKWNALVDRVNKAGGEAIFSRPAQSKAAPQFTVDELRTLIQLCHPDKHDGKESAVRMTQKLNQMRASL
jgi:hypothetical protein